MARVSVGHAVHAAVGDAPEAALAAAVIEHALRRARRGSHPDRAWLVQCAGLIWIPMLTPPDLDPEDVHRTLLQLQDWYPDDVHAKGTP